jgi:hypothetical protein
MDSEIRYVQVVSKGHYRLVEDINSVLRANSFQILSKEFSQLSFGDIFYINDFDTDITSARILVYKL